MWALWAAGFLPWPDSHFFRQPANCGLLHSPHIDTKLSADTWSTWRNLPQEPCPHTILLHQPPRRLDDRARHGLQLKDQLFFYSIEAHVIVGPTKTWTEKAGFRVQSCALYQKDWKVNTIFLLWTLIVVVESHVLKWEKIIRSHRDLNSDRWIQSPKC